MERPATNTSPPPPPHTQRKSKDLHPSRLQQPQISPKTVFVPNLVSRSSYLNHPLKRPRPAHHIHNLTKQSSEQIQQAAKNQCARTAILTTSEISLGGAMPPLQVFSKSPNRPTDVVVIWQGFSSASNTRGGVGVVWLGHWLEVCLCVLYI